TRALDAHESQFYEWLPWTSHRLADVPTDPQERLRWLGKVRKRPVTSEIRNSLVRWYGNRRGSAVLQAEAFELCEYGRQPGVSEIKRLFPMLPPDPQKDNTLRAVSANAPITIDGKLTESLYELAPKLMLQNSLDPEEMLTNQYTTYAQIGYDHENLYIAFSCDDRDIWCTFSERDQRLWEQEVVEVFIDTDENPLDYVEIEVSPTNILYDSWITDPKNITRETADYNIKGIETAVHVEGTTDDRSDQDTRWTVEMSIPLNELTQASARTGQEWKINFYRINHDAHGPRLLAYSPTEGSFHTPERFVPILLDPASEEEWIPLFNGKDLNDWQVKIRGYELNDNYASTFRVEDGTMTVSYDQYEGDYDARFGHIFYKDPFSYYRIRIEHRFIGDQVPGGPGWAYRNSGVMLHCQAPETMLKDQDFPISIEAQMLGGNGKDMRSTMNLCTPGTNVVMDGDLFAPHCINSRSSTYHGDVWVSAEALVLGDSSITHFVQGQPVIEYENPQFGGGNVNPFDDSLMKEGDLISGGYISLQSESHPIQFRSVELLNLEGCMDPKASNYKSYFVKDKPESCKY
ncbi:MAG: carbohydrate-binding family 9-like protein, partial [Saprospiraceae bacterium]|nr:carbohydrate-binding family 9-like protein [Saprospiraceae bacterium]